jgi:hypothetical protein
MKARSTPMIAGGTVLVSVAATMLIAGAALFAGADNSSGPIVCGGQFGNFCMSAPADSGAKAGGVAMMVIGLAGMAAGIPLIAVGAQKVPDREEAHVLLPTVRIGAGSAALRWTF